MSRAPGRSPSFTRGDLDGFFGLMVDNLAQVLMITALCPLLCGIPAEVVYTRILPGVAVSLLLGNLFYTLQARVVARRTNNPTCTALPYGINTPSVFAFILFVMQPVYRANADALGPAAAGELAWKAGMVACLVSGAIEFFGAFFAQKLRDVTPRAALLAVLASIGLTFISAEFAFRIFAHPVVALVPLGVLLLAYLGGYRFPFGLPGGLIAVLLGAALAWISAGAWAGERLGVAPLVSTSAVAEAWALRGWIVPQFFGGEILAALSKDDLLVRYLAVSVPMGLINLLGSLQNLESAEAAGDRFSTAPSLAANGLGSIAAGLFGSCFPTTIYIGHPAWKALGARSGYSILNGLFYTLIFLAGLGPVLAKLIPLEAGAAIVVYIGILITAQAFQATPTRHAPAVALALFPALAAFLVVTGLNLASDAGATRGLPELLRTVSETSRVPVLPGIVALHGANSSWFVVTLFFAAIAAALIDRKYAVAAAWSAVAAVLTAAGFLHAYRAISVGGDNQIRELFLWQSSGAADGDTFAYRALPIAAAYGLLALLFLLAARHAGRPDGDAPPPAAAS